MRRSTRRKKKGAIWCGSPMPSTRSPPPDRGGCCGSCSEKRASSPCRGLTGSQDRQLGSIQKRFEISIKSDQVTTRALYCRGNPSIRNRVGGQLMGETQLLQERPFAPDIRHLSPWHRE